MSAAGGQWGFHLTDETWPLLVCSRSSRSMQARTRIVRESSSSTLTESNGALGAFPTRTWKTFNNRRRQGKPLARQFFNRHDLSTIVSRARQNVKYRHPVVSEEQTGSDVDMWDGASAEGSVDGCSACGELSLLTMHSLCNRMTGAVATSFQTGRSQSTGLSS
jgi:hypothetical protein